MSFGNGATSAWTSSVCHENYAIDINETEARFWFQCVGTFVVRGGTEVIINPRGDYDVSLLRLYVQGMMMATILHQRGMCVLHASVIEVNGAAIACLGNIGAGKSSTAAAMYARGYRVLTDDNAAVGFAAGEPVIVPGYPSVKLYPAIAASLGFENGSLSVLHQTQQKLAGAVNSGFTNRTLPLRAIYILGRDHDPEITRVSPLDAVIQLILNAVPTRWGHAGDSRQLRQCAAIANRIPVFAIRTFRELSELQRVVNQLEYHQKILSGDPTQIADPALQIPAS